MRRFGRLLVVVVSLGVLAGCGAVPRADEPVASAPIAEDVAVRQVEPPDVTVTEGDGQGVDRFSGSSTTLSDPDWREEGSAYTYDINVEPEHRVRFALNSALIDEEASRVLAHNAAWVRAHHPTGMLTIEGHCDERGTREYNLALGQQRADAVLRFLVSQGMDETRLKTVSYGKERPLVWGHDASAWKENRRAEIVFP